MNRGANFCGIQQFFILIFDFYFLKPAIGQFEFLIDLYY